MIYVEFTKSSKGTRFRLINKNGHVLNHFYNTKSGAKKAARSMIKQIQEGKIEFREK